MTGALQQFTWHQQESGKMSIGMLLGWELVLTALFLLTIFIATRRGTPANLAPFAIGGFLFVAHLVGEHLGD